MIYKESFKVQSNDKVCTFHNVTAKAREIVERSGVQNGIAVIYSHHTTCCVITQECAFDMSMTGLETLQQDLVDVMESPASHPAAGRGSISTRARRRWPLPKNTARTRGAATTPTRICAPPLWGGAKPS